MKNLFGIVTLFLIASAIYSCSKGNPKNVSPTGSTTTTAIDADAKTQALLIGKWRLIGDTLKETANGVVTQYVKAPQSLTMNNIFNADGTWSEIFGGSNPVNGNYAVKGSTIVFTNINQSSSSAGYTRIAYVKSVTSTDLLIYYTETVLRSTGSVDTYESYHMTK